MKKSLSFIIVFIFFSFVLYAQEGDDLLIQETRVQELKDQAIELTAKGEYLNALELVGEAILLAPQDESLQNLKAGIIEFYEIDKKNKELNIYNPNFEEGYGLMPEQTVAAPDFTQEFLASQRKTNLEKLRPAFTTSLAVFGGQSRPFNFETLGTSPDSSEPLSIPFTGLSTDLSYYFPSFKRIIGLEFSYEGHFTKDATLYQYIDLSANFRTFFAEEELARMILGLKFGGSFFFLNSSDQELTSSRNNGLLLGLFFEDPLLRHLLKKSIWAKKLNFGLSLTYHYLKDWENGILSSYRLKGEYPLTKHFKLGLNASLLNNTNQFNSINNWDLGAHLTYFY